MPLPQRASLVCFLVLAVGTCTAADDPKSADSAEVKNFYALPADAIARLGDLTFRHGSEPALVHYNLALVCQAQGRPDQALMHVRQALGQRPDFPLARELEKQLLMK